MIAIAAVVSEHLEEARFLWTQRRRAVHAPNYSRRQFTDLDQRLEAHIDGLRVAEAGGWDAAVELLESPQPHDFFPVAVLAIEAVDGRLVQIVERAEEMPAALPALISALGWVRPKCLGGQVKPLLEAASPVRQYLGIAACAVHRRDPGLPLEHALSSGVPAVRCRALRSAGELGRLDLLPMVLNGLGDDLLAARFYAARSAVLLGHRGKALEALIGGAFETGPHQLACLGLSLQSAGMERGHEVLRQLGEVPDANRLRILGSGFLGSVRYVPWLIEQMSRPVLARVAGEAFVNITGADFNLGQLAQPPPADFEDGPTEDPADENVEVPEDVALPWPDAERVKLWWDQHRARFDPTARYLLGLPLGRDACADVLKGGFQRQRVMAAVHLALLNPGASLFNTSAPAWRQQKLLTQ